MLLRLCGSLYRREFSFCARWAELRIFVNKELQPFPVFCLTKQKGSVELVLLALQSNWIGSLLINDGTLGEGIKELKPGAATPGVRKDGATAIIGLKSGFIQRVKERNPSVIGTHCVLHREALALRTLLLK